MNTVQIVAISIFISLFVALIIGKVHRYIPAMVAAAVMSLLLIISEPKTLLELLRLDDFTHLSFWITQEVSAEFKGGVNWQTIIFIGGMMTMIEGLHQAGFFRWICLVAAKAVDYRIMPVALVFTLLAGFLAMFIDSITVLLFLASVTIELARLLKFDPRPVIIFEIAAANIGGSATMVGDPPNVIIGTSLGYTFTDFAVNTGPIALVGMLMVMVILYLILRRTLVIPTPNEGATSPAEPLKKTVAGIGPPSQSAGLIEPFVPPPMFPQPKEAILNPRLFKMDAAIFIVVVILLITHAQTRLSVAVVGIIAALLTLLCAGRGAGAIAKKIDWRTLLFFFGLFVCVAVLEAVGLLEILSNYIGKLAGGNVAIVISAILWVSAFASAIVDNIPFAASMVPVINGLAVSQGFELRTLSWALALGADIGGNGTPIGASANVVGTAIAEREGYPIGWGRYCKYAIPATLLVVAVCNLYLLFRYAQ